MNEVTFTVSLADLRELDKGALVELLKAAIRTGSIDGQQAMVVASECDVELIS